MEPMFLSIIEVAPVQATVQATNGNCYTCDDPGCECYSAPCDCDRTPCNVK